MNGGVLLRPVPRHTPSDDLLRPSTPSHDLLLHLTTLCFPFTPTISPSPPTNSAFRLHHPRFTPFTTSKTFETPSRPLQDSLRPLRLLRQPSITYLRACGLTLGEYGGLSNYDVIAQLRSPSRSFHRLTVDSAMTHPPRTLAAHSSTLEGI